jgi:glycosyltransferase involved in cell wall biosynthesis
MYNSPIKVLYLLHDTRRSGVPAVAFHAITALDRSVIVPTVLCAYDGIYARNLREAGVKVLTLGKRTPFIWRCKRFLMNLVLAAAARRFDVIHIHSSKLAFLVIWARLLGCRVVFHLHELPRSVGYLLRKAMGCADAVVFCSATCAAHFADIPVKRAHTVVNALNFPETAPVRHLEVGGKIVMAASINKNKGQDLLLEAFARLGRDDVELWLYGTVGLSARGFVKHLKQRVKDLGLEERVHFPGPTTDVLEVFRTAAVVVHTSWTESFGMALVEAQSCGVPVIAHDLEGMREVVADGVTGYLIPPGDVGELTKRLEQLLDDPDLRNRFGNAGAKMVRERFGIGNIVAAYSKIYREVTSR